MTLDFSIFDKEDIDFVEESISPKTYFKTHIEWFTENYAYPDDVVYEDSEYESGYGLYDKVFKLKWDTAKKTDIRFRLEEVVLATTNNNETSIKFRFKVRGGDVVFNYSPLFDSLECIDNYGIRMPVQIFSSDGVVEFFLLKTISHFNKKTQFKERLRMFF